MIEILRKWYRACISFIYPLKCIVCNLSIPLEEINNEFLCSRCLAKIRFIMPPLCQKCGKPSNSNICFECNTKHNIFFDRAFSIAVYEDVWKELIHLFKYNNNDYLDGFLASFLTKLIYENPFLKESDLIIPVPLYWQDRLKRGYNQTYLLACQISRNTDIPVCVEKLIKYKKTPSQTKLSRRERINNIKGIFKLKNHKILENKKIILIDDVFTTGSTVNECARMLREAKAKCVNVITLACSCEV